MWPFGKKKVKLERPCSVPSLSQDDIENDTKVLEAALHKCNRETYALMNEVGVKAVKVKERALKIVEKCAKRIGR